MIVVSGVCCIQIPEFIFVWNAPSQGLGVAKPSHSLGFETRDFIRLFLPMTYGQGANAEVGNLYALPAGTGAGTFRLCRRAIFRYCGKCLVKIRIFDQTVARNYLSALCHKTK